MQPDISAIVLSILRILHQRCQSSSPSPALLHIIQTVLGHLVPDATIAGFLLQFLEAFCQWVPHSVYDMTFNVLQILIKMTQPYIHEEHIEFVVQALLDPYTVKSTSHKKCVMLFIATVMGSQSPLINDASSKGDSANTILTTSTTSTSTTTVTAASTITVTSRASVELSNGTFITQPETCNDTPLVPVNCRHLMCIVDLCLLRNKIPIECMFL